MSIHDRARQPAGTPTGGQFAPQARPGAGLSLSEPSPTDASPKEACVRRLAQNPTVDATFDPFPGHTGEPATVSAGTSRSEQEMRDHLIEQAGQAGWVLAGEQAARLQADGLIDSADARALTSAHMTILGEDIMAPTVNDVEDTLAQWMRADDRPHGADGRFNTAHLERVCDEAGIPRDVIGYLKAVDDRENVPTQFLSNLTGSELADLHEQFVGPAGEQIAAEVGDPGSQMWREAAAL